MHRVAADAFNIFVNYWKYHHWLVLHINSRWSQPSCTASGFKYLILWAPIGATFYLIGVGLIYMMDRHAFNPRRYGKHDIGERDRYNPITSLRLDFITIGLPQSALFPLHADGAKNGLYHTCGRHM